MALGDVFRALTLQQKSQVPELAPPFGFPAPVSPRGISTLANILPPPSIELTPEESSRIQSYVEARLVMGAAAGAIMICSIECPRISLCPLAAIHKAPPGHPCPIEVHYAKERFGRWAQEIGADPDHLGETERIAVGQLAGVDVQEQRCLDIVAVGEDARLTQKSVKDCDVNGQPIAWEVMIHQNLQLVELLHQRRRAILRDWELTPEMQSKKTRGMIKNITDLASRSTDNADKLRAVIKKRSPIIDVNTSK